MSMLPSIPASRPLGTSGISVSSLAWGMSRFSGSDADAARLVHIVLDSGITLFDTADIYGFNGVGGFGDAELLLGRVFAAEPGLRSRLVLATKGGILPPLPYDQSASYLAKALDDSLRRLCVDQVELYQIHRPDILAHPQEVARTLENMVTSGKVRALGVSNMTVHQIAALQHFLPMPLATTQPEISPLRITCLENGEIDQAMMMAMTPLAWSPLGGGRMTDPQGERAIAVARELDRVGQVAGVSRTAAACSWLMVHPAGIIPIVGTQNAARVADAVDALKVTWTRTDWYAVFVAARGEKLP